MKLKLALLIILLYAFTGMIQPKVIASFDDVMNPNFIISDDKNIYVAEGTSVYIYALKDFKLIKKFGKRGEGPKEFLGSVQRIVPGKDTILINSQNKISYYSKRGEYVSEMNTKGGSSMGNYFPVTGGFVGATMTAGNGKLAAQIVMFDKELQKKRVLTQFPVGPFGKMDVFAMVRAMTFFVDNDRIYAPGIGASLDIFDPNGKQLNSVKLDKEKEKLTKTQEKAIRKLMKREMPPGQYEAIKDMFVFPEFFPALQYIFVSKNSVYAISYCKEKDNYKTYITDSNGKGMKKSYVTLKMRDGIRPYPLFIKNGKLYQLIENEDSETWELHENSF